MIPHPGHTIIISVCINNNTFRDYIASSMKLPYSVLVSAHGHNMIPYVYRSCYSVRLKCGTWALAWDTTVVAKWGITLQSYAKINLNKYACYLSVTKVNCTLI